MHHWSGNWNVPKQNINIERLEIRLRGASPEPLRATVREFGQDLLEQLSANTEFRAQRIDRVDSGTLQVNAGARPAELSSRMAKHVAASIRAKLK